MLAPLSSRLLRKPKTTAGVCLFVFVLILLHFRGDASTSLSSSLPSWTPSPFYEPWPEGGSRYYSYKTSAFFPPLKTTVTKQANLCANFPTHMLKSVQVVLKAGSGEPEKNRAHIATVTSCISNLLVFSDLEEHIGDHHFIDILGELPTSYSVDNPDFATYTTQKEIFQKEGKVGYSSEGWRLDRFKFLPMVEKAYELNPTAEWYVFIEADVYYFWDTLFRFLSQLDSSKMHYMGSPAPGANGLFFAYGGAGLVLSRGLLKEYLRGEKPSVEYQDLVKNDCCGDAVLGYAIYDKTEVKLQALYPMFSGDDLQGLRVNAEWWCVPLLALHRVTPELMKSLWQWERTRPYNENPFTMSTTLAYSFSSLRGVTTRANWDNLASEIQSEGQAHESLSACRSACFRDDGCFQYTYAPNTCKFGRYIQSGHAVSENDNITAGWDMEKIKRLGFTPDADFSDSCKIPAWLKPEVR